MGDILFEGLIYTDEYKNRKGTIFCPTDGDNDPHIHFHSSSLSKGGDIGIKLRDAYYHKHPSCRGEFKNAKAIEEFVKFLDRVEYGSSNWVRVLKLWNNVHKHAPIHCLMDLNYQRPNYFEIQDIPRGQNAHGKRGNKND